ncbi:hypothetical protein M409DRAFT_71513 [Zasmidium cellare ATCC 36951]|uniref:F-box domain-containing protein n=1 Tax=Zasmidium cellare ATCC 36951 TaxID=1080233 RepID=A0A6A6BVE4_ZASCE|nr:uncharacterized protein M409DRAFT_71513 [Zasmidium cellare ATCC 36951]KAF2158655.1 hypothetical protein M409DRAFT_71513 [Zasmidium cellare ATCC 36951]
MVPTPKASKLLQLPAELRLLILEHVFAHERSPIAIGLPSAPWQGKPQRYHPPISEVCSTLRKESLPLFYEDCVVILLLRFREGRGQVRHWIRHVYSNPAMCTRVRKVRLQYFEECHRSTAVDLDMQELVMRNKNSWLHPLTGRPLRLLGQIESALSEERTLPQASHTDKATLLQHLISIMTAPLKMSRLMRQESMANLRLHGYTDFDLRFEYPLGAGGSYNLSVLAPKIFGGDAAKQCTQSSLLRVSRQLRRETLAMFYRLNTFILAVHYRRARAEVDRWIDVISSQPDISMNLRTVTIKHRFGILDFRGTIDFDLHKFVIIGPKLWYNAIPPLIRKEVESIIDEAHATERTHDVIASTLRRLVDVLGVEPPTTSP